MKSQRLLHELHVARARAATGGGQAALLTRFGEALDVLTCQQSDPETPERSRRKIAIFLEQVEAARERIGASFMQPSYLLNVLGDAVVRSDLIHREVTRCLQVGLYFFGLDQIERRWSAQAAIYSGLHADLLTRFLGRDSLKGLIKQGRERIAEERIFCLTYAYLNALRRAYWDYCRNSQDALDMAVTGEELAALPLQAPDGDDEVETSLEPGDRVGLMLDIFDRCLTPDQQWIYLAKNRSHLQEVPSEEAATSRAQKLELLLRSLEDKDETSDLCWPEIAGRLGINEKTAKREYLKALHTLLVRSSEYMFGETWIPSGYVKRVLQQIRTVVTEKDLRIKHSTGRGLGTLVKKWEVALRFVLNHQKVSA